MQIHFFLSTTVRSGASALLDPIAYRLELGLGDYGAAIEEVEVLVALGAEAGRLVPLREGQLGKLPYRRFLRAKKRLKLGFLSHDVGEDLAPEECDPAATMAILPEVEAALLSFEGALKAGDDFDFPRYAADVKRLLGKGFHTVEACKAEEAEAFARHEAEYAAEAVAASEEPEGAADQKIHTYIIRVPQAALDAVAGDPIRYQNQFPCIGDWVEFSLRNKLRGLGPQLTLELVPPGSPREMIADWVVAAPFDRAAFDAEDDLVAKKRLIAEMARDTLAWFAERWGQDPAPVHGLFAEMEAAEFQRAGTLKARIEPKRGAFEARIEFVHELDGVDLTAAFVRRGKRKVESRVALGRCPYHPLLLGRLHEFSRFERGELVIEVPVVEWTARVAQPS